MSLSSQLKELGQLGRNVEDAAAQGSVEKLRLDFSNEKNTMEGELRSIRQGDGSEAPATAPLPGAGGEADDAQ